MAAPHSTLLSVVYRSEASPGTDASEVGHVLQQSRAKNPASGITGMLLVEQGRFLQALEGPEDEVRALLGRIAADPRHHDVQVLDEQLVAVRRFPDWAMANGRMGDPDARPLERYYEILTAARQVLPKPAARESRLRSWLRG